MDTSDWVKIGTTAALGSIALFVPTLSEIVKRNLFRPKLRIDYDHNPPYSHLTSSAPVNNPSLRTPVYYFRFGVENTGGSQARLCEAVLKTSGYMMPLANQLNLKIIPQ
jgi:hypothetical protein